MREKKELTLLRTIKTGKGLIKLVTSLRSIRRREKFSGRKRGGFTKGQRELILSKTNSHCHVCGIEVSITEFQADHVKSHCMGGEHNENNYLPACATCNKSRWHHSSEEIQILLKLGQWAKTTILKDSDFALEVANSFVKHEMSLRKRRKGRIKI